MNLIKTIFISCRVLALIFPVTAWAEITPSVELPLAEDGYDFRSDPFLLQWTFAVEQDTKPVTELSPQDKMLRRWKEKQAHLWDSLEIGRKFTVNASAYTAAADECGKSDGITASGLKVEEGRTLACPPSFPFGAKIAIEGVGIFRCEDRGGAIKGNRVDIYMEKKSDAFAFGRRHLEAEIVD